MEGPKAILKLTEPSRHLLFIQIFKLENQRASFTGQWLNRFQKVEHYLRRKKIWIGYQRIGSLFLVVVGGRNTIWRFNILAKNHPGQKLSTFELNRSWVTQPCYLGKAIPCFETYFQERVPVLVFFLLGHRKWLLR